MTEQQLGALLILFRQLEGLRVGLPHSVVNARAAYKAAEDCGAIEAVEALRGVARKDRS